MIYIDGTDTRRIIINNSEFLFVIRVVRLIKTFENLNLSINNLALNLATRLLFYKIIKTHVRMFIFIDLLTYLKPLYSALNVSVGCFTVPVFKENVF